MKRWLANSISTLVATLVGALTIYLSRRYLKQPEGFVDWAVLMLSALTTGTIAFFMTWGHFQEEPGLTACPNCGSPLAQVDLGCPKCNWKSGDSLAAPKQS